MDPSEVVIEYGQTKLEIPNLDPYEDLTIHIENSNQDTLIRWKNFNAVPSVVKFTPGAYKVVAEYGPDQSLPVFEDEMTTHHFRAENKFVIAAGDEIQVDLLVKMATTMVSVTFDESFDYYYGKYEVDIRTAAEDFITFRKGETRKGYFEPGAIRMRFNLTMKDFTELTYSPPAIANGAAATHYKLNLKVNSDAGSGSIVDINTDESTDREIVYDIEIPQYFLPKDGPSVTNVNGFQNGVDMGNVIEGSIPGWDLSAQMPGGLGSFLLTVKDPDSFLAQRLGTTQVDIAALAVDDPMRTQLKELGFAWTSALNSPEEAEIATSLWFDFTDVMVADGNETDYEFTITIADPYEQSVDCDVKVCMVPARIAMTTGQGYMWATKAEFIVETNFDMATGTMPALYYRKNGAQTWNMAIEGQEVSYDHSYSPDSPDPETPYSARYVLKNLQTDTEYDFFVSLNTLQTMPETFRTESIVQIPNSDFETFGTTERFGGILQYNWNGWATRNSLTTGQTAYSKNANGQGANETTVTEVSSNNGTEVQFNPLDYSNAIQLQTTGWGRGTYSNPTIEAPGAIIVGGGEPAIASRVRNASSGILFLGEYSYNPFGTAEETWTYRPGAIGTSSVKYPFDTFNGESIEETGILFGSRPSAFKFQYKFTPIISTANPFLIRAQVYGDVEGVETLLGEAILSHNEETAMAYHTVTFDYDENYRYVPATKLKVFMSSDSDLSVLAATSSTKTVEGKSPYVIKRQAGKHYGNTLLVDNLELVYEY